MKAQRLSCAVVCLTWLCWLFAPTVYAQMGEAIPAHIRVEMPQALRQGSATYRWFGLRIYDATLWTDSAGWNDQFAQKMALDLRYARSLLGHKIAEVSMQEMEKLQPRSKLQRQQWLQQMTALFPDVKEGTHITGIYVPNQSARFYLDGKWLGEIHDADFARAFFAIWLDPRTSVPDLRKELLGVSAPSH